MYALPSPPPPAPQRQVLVGVSLAVAAAVMMAGSMLAVWALSVLVFVLQLWWVGWGLRDLPLWDFTDFLVLVFGCVCIFGASEMAMPVPGEGTLDMQEHSQTLGRLSALSMLAYFAIGPYVNVAMMGNPLLPSLVVPGLGVVLMALFVARPRWFSALALTFAAYSTLIVVITA